jgi:nucleotide-binding universal stress UspA family protein
MSMYRSILVPVDLDQPSSWEKALPAAIPLCRCFDASLALVTVVPDWRLALEAQWSPIAFDEFLDIAKARLATLAGSVTEIAEVGHHVETGSVYAGILAVAERAKADLIVLSSHRPEMKDYLLGTNASRVVRHARCSVFVVRD